MADMEVLDVIAQQEARFEAAGFKQGLHLAHSVRDHLDEINACNRKLADAKDACVAAAARIARLSEAALAAEEEARKLNHEAKGMRLEIARQRVIVRSVAMLERKQRVIQTKFDEKFKKLGEMAV